MTADIGGSSPASNQPDNQLVQQQRTQNPNSTQQLDKQQLALSQQENNSRTEEADQATISSEATEAVQRTREVPVRDAEDDALQAVEDDLDYARQSVNNIREMAREERDNTSTVDEVAQKQQKVDRNLDDLSVAEQEINRRLEEQAEKRTNEGRPAFVLKDNSEEGRIVTGSESQYETDMSEMSLSDMYSGGAASLENNPQAAEDVTTRVMEDMSELQVGVDNVRSGIYSNISPNSISALEGALGNAQAAREDLNSVVGNLMNNNGALLEAASGNISGERVFDLLAGN